MKIMAKNNVKLFNEIQVTFLITTFISFVPSTNLPILKHIEVGTPCSLIVKQKWNIDGIVRIDYTRQLVIKKINMGVHTIS